MAARLANPSANTAEEMSGPKGTIRVFQPIWTPASMSCSMTEVPLCRAAHVVRRTHPDLAGFDVRVFLGNVEIRLPDDPQRFLDFKSENGGHARIQKGPEIRQVVLALYMGRQELACEFKGFFQIFKGFHFHPGE
jgi:hypothetical protein